MHTPTHDKQLSRFDRIVESEMSGCRAIRPRINDKFVTAKTNTLKWIERFSGEMPPGLLLAGVSHTASRSPICATTWRRPRIIRWRCASDRENTTTTATAHQDRPYRIFHHIRHRSPGAAACDQKAFRAGQSVKTLRQDIDEAISDARAVEGDDEDDGTRERSADRIYCGGQCQHDGRRKTEIVP